MLGPGVSQALAGLSAATRSAAKAREQAPAKPKGVPATREERDEVVVHTETADAVRGLKDNTHEEAHQDHAEHGDGARDHQRKAARPHIDVQG